ncbi:hypothetical protein CROQUDRAFT_38914, partial [Cronartium quercuum f. sp. fusiforme G11]
DVCLDFGGLTFKQECRVAPLKSYDVILGMDWITRHALSTDWETGVWSLRDQKGLLGEFHVENISQPQEQVHLLEGEAKIAPEDLPINWSRMRRFLRHKGTEVWLIQGHEDLCPTTEVRGPCEEEEVPVPKISTEDPRLVAAAKKLLEEHRHLFNTVSAAPKKERVIKHLIDTGEAEPVSQPV